ncbi:SDR family NAD(P)-dependent oxidoreductase [Candidatus Hepatobacter penaei]|uniref:SDR family NAD(P)-dependent oxidoreductase n=1 Tax=Candidatus Hepatobacter penaei TaxID=1274402 RepID=UPI000696402A|nr:SDR family NAD(P)-dependent oxidoreductase [Candidatus Hepatobacter penaei]TGW15681.1 SDR family NAD(P)-dependent oxidoreductase [bacterium NHP-B]
MTDSSRVALVTGGTGGIGQEICKQLAHKGYHVLCAGRNSLHLAPLTNTFAKEGARVRAVSLDVTSEKSIQNLVDETMTSYGRLDVLINNAGVYLDGPQEGAYPDFLNMDPSLLTQTLDVNLYGPLRLMKMFLPMMKQHNFGRIVNVSSGMGRFAEMDRRAIFYRLSKVALNALTLMVADSCQAPNILINAVCPGWVRTKMGGKNAVRSPEEGAAGIVWAATLPDGGPTGGFFRDAQALDWCQLSPTIDTWAFDGPFY